MSDSRATLLLLPGLNCDADVWAEQTAALGGSVTCIAPRYHDLDSIVAMADRVLEEAPPRFALAGHSMGGRVALEIVRTAPERVSRLALLDSGYQARPAGERGQHEARQRRRLVELARESGMRAMGAEWVRGMVHPARIGDSALIARILAMIERHTPEESLGPDSCIARASRRERCAPASPLPDAPRLRPGGCLESASASRGHGGADPAQYLVVIEQCGHMSTMERPAQVTAALRNWLEEEVHRA